MRPKKKMVMQSKARLLTPKAPMTHRVMTQASRIFLGTCSTRTKMRMPKYSRNNIMKLEINRATNTE